MTSDTLHTKSEPAVLNFDLHFVDLLRSRHNEEKPFLKKLTKFKR